MVIRIPTGIKGFDQLIDGGVPIGSIVLLAGNAGSGKTLFASHMINSHSQHGKSLYCGFFEKKENFINNAMNFGFDFRKFEFEGKLAMSEYFPILESGIAALVSDIERDIHKVKPSLLVIDSVSTLAGDLRGRQEVRILLKMIDSITKAYNITVVLVTELPLNYSDIGFGVEEFMADSIIILRYVEIDGVIRRCLAVMKMRETKHDMNINEYVIGPNGIEVKGRISGVDGLIISSSKIRSAIASTEENIEDEVT